ncbi:MAG: T9SS type A sorting domain-containing protein [Bacteroidota bacterium]|nr:T9SS type A sorting domain-containing protein [Bacteroidota bacterium]
MNKIFTCLLILLLSVTQGYSQQLITTAGAQQNNVSWSIGEMVTESGSVAGLMINQGFNGFENIIRTGISAVEIFTVQTYPNPVIDKLFLKFTDGNTYSYILTDIVGRVLLNKSVHLDQEIDLSHYDAGQYILKVNSNRFSKSTIIIKK